LHVQVRENNFATSSDFLQEITLKWRFNSSRETSDLLV